MTTWSGRISRQAQQEPALMSPWFHDTKRKFALVTVATIILVVLSILFIDQSIALYAHNSNSIQSIIHMLLSTISSTENPNNEIADFLTPLTLVIILISWTGYWLRSRHGHFDHHTYFFKMVGTAVPIAFLAKTITKFVFGRINTRVWVSDPAPGDNFHWFDGGGNYNGFPSGHMTVLVPLFIALWQFYPALRPLWGAAAGSLAIAMVLTDYHFVSDIIAGTYLGILVYCFSLKKQMPNAPSCTKNTKHLDPTHPTDLS